MKGLKIKEAFHSIRNGANIKQDKTSGGIPVTRIETISESTIDLEKLGYAGITDDSFKNFYLQEGDILMSHINSVSHLGKVAIFENRSETIIHGMNLLCLKAKKNILYPKYAYYFFRSPIFINSIKPITKKSVNQASFNISNFENLEIIIPEKREDQIGIATLLSKLEILIKQRKESIDLLDAFLKNTFLKMFGDPVRNDKGWEMKRLEEITTKITDGKHGDCENEENSGYYFISAKDLVDGKINYEGVREITKKDFDETHKRTQLKLNDILIGNTGASIGKIAIVTDESKANRTTFQKSIAIVTVDERSILSKFLMAYLIPNKDYLDKISSGSGQKNLLLSQLRNLKLIIPPITLQTQFAQIVEKTETLKIQNKTSLQKLENLFASLSQKAFKGELDLSKMEVDESLLPKLEATEKKIEISDPTILKALEAATSISKHFEKANELAKVANRFNIYFKQWDKLIEPINKLPEIPTELIEAQQKIENIKSAFSGVTPISIDKSEKLKWESVSFQQVSNWIKENYTGFHFSNEMLINYLTNERITFPDYYSSEELKKFPQTNEADDLKSFIFSAIDKENPFIHLEQLFYDAEKENISLKLTPDDFTLIKNRTPKERSGIYFKIVPNEIN